LETRIAPGFPKSKGTVKSAAYSKICSLFDGFGNHPLTNALTLFPELVSARTTKP
jgi:hypothetical protein